MPKLLTLDFAEFIGADVTSFPPESLDTIENCNWNYTVIEGEERDALIADLLRRIEQRAFSVVANQDKSRWVKGWGENLDALVKSGGDLQALVPRYYKSGLPLRLKKEFIRAEDPNFELNFFYILRHWLFKNFFKDHNTIFELGSGSGFNVAELAQTYPQATIHGLDWAPPAVEIIETLRTTNRLNVHGHAFDFFHPDYGLDVPPGSAFYSFGALEQTGTAWQPLLDFLLAKKPSIVCHIEPIIEWYDPANSKVDDTAYKATAARNFLQGYAPAIEKLEKDGRARILKAKRTYFGSTWHEGWSQLFWQPL